MTKKEYGKALAEMKREGKAMLKVRPDFSFGEWAGESDREMIESITGYEMESFTDWQIDKLLDGFLGE